MMSSMWKGRCQVVIVLESILLHIHWTMNEEDNVKPMIYFNPIASSKRLPSRLLTTILYIAVMESVPSSTPPFHFIIIQPHT